MFVDMLQEFPSRVDVVLDALDECSNPSMIITNLLSPSLAVGHSARFLIIGRSEQGILPVLKSASNVSIVIMSLDNDIKKFIEEEVNSLPSLRRHRDAVVSTVMERSSGMFRFATLVLAELKTSSI